jgi:C4-dicarboxylate-specific signal transduction histidine kinase
VQPILFVHCDQFSSEGEATNTEIEMSDLISLVLSIAKPEIHSKNIQAVLNIEPSLALSADSSEIQQLLLNLINNAIQALVTCESSSQAIGDHSIKSWR